MEELSVLDYLKLKLASWIGRGNGEALPPLRMIEAAADKAGNSSALASGSALSGNESQVLSGIPAVGTQENISSSPGLRSDPEVRLDEVSSQPLAVPGRGIAMPIARPALPFRTLAALTFALLAQFSLEPPTPSVAVGVSLYLIASALAIWACMVGEWRLPEPDSDSMPAVAVEGVDQTREISYLQPVVTFNHQSLLISIPLLLLAFYLFGGNRFTVLNVLVWALGFFFLLRAFWQPALHKAPWGARLKDFLSRPYWSVKLTRAALVGLAAIILVVFFRVYRLNAVPPEMISDHAEKLLDVWDVLAGRTSIFFPRNTGREALQMYLTAAIARYLGTGISFLSLKIGTVLSGLLTLPFIYLLAKEIGGRRAGLLAMVFAGIAYWPNVISRIGLRFPLYPLFVAPVLYFLLRGLRKDSQNDFILAGIALGIGLHGYTPIRILPFVVLLAFGLYSLHALIRARKKTSTNGEPDSQASIVCKPSVPLGGLLLVGLFSLVLFLPLLRYALEAPELFAFRSFTRLGTVERALPGSPLGIFLNNLWRAEISPLWDDGEIWVTSVTHRPALEPVSAALYALGSLLLLVRYIRRRNWIDLFLLLSVPLLMLPSILSLAFPAENPSLNRMAGAIVPIFIIIGLALDGILSAFERYAGSAEDKAKDLKPSPVNRKLSTWLVGGFLLLFSIQQNYDLVFNQYYRAFRNGSWNSSEMGKVIAQFANTIGSGENAWVVAFPHWVDTRLVGIHAGYPLRDFAIWPENFEGTLSVPGPKLFLIRPDDNAGLDKLRSLYPLGALSEYPSPVEGHSFYIFFVPG